MNKYQVFQVHKFCLQTNQWYTYSAPNCSKAGFTTIHGCEKSAYSVSTWVGKEQGNAIHTMVDSFSLNCQLLVEEPPLGSSLAERYLTPTREVMGSRFAS